VHNDDESSSSDPGRFAEVQVGVCKHCSRCLVPGFDGAFLSHDSKDALWDRDIRPVAHPMCKAVDRCRPDVTETARAIRVGVQNALPADGRLLDILLADTRRTIPSATWTAAGIGRHQSLVMQWALEGGVDAVPTGMEDNIRIAKDRLASGNDELVHIAVGLLERFGCRPATPAEARSSLSLRPA
jgi:hypothetical protein